jgi:hypothetical protein
VSRLSKVLNKFGRLAVEKAQLELGVDRKIDGKRVRRVSSGNLQNSLAYRPFVTRDGFRVDFFAKGDASKYADFIEQGVSGTRKKYDTPYSFRGKFVNIGAVERWIRTKPLRLRDKEGRFIEMSDKNIKSASFVMARSIAQKGIAGIRYFIKGVENALGRMEDEIAEAVADDLTINIDL